MTDFIAESNGRARIATLESQIARLRAEIEKLRANAEADNSHAMSTAADNEKLAARIAELERMVVWAVRHDASTETNSVGECWLEWGSYPRLRRSCVLTEAGILAAVKEAMGDGVS